ncbi:hypothetical protein [Streptomyces sp. CL7]|uniref:hypothetical protein n=1 Tax=Streptomyces sp. CL7 TaxID=3096006 RepID=UPI002A7488C5|nr:hypothetical protein [Streptomyces sp. CL7]WPP32277.1 hypothetical protein SJH97_24430 [Streptomyces sp. CL7]
MLGELALAAPWLLALLLGGLALIVLVSLPLSLRGSEASERPEIIRALAEFWRFWRR